jgi:hypothetical protein
MLAVLEHTFLVLLVGAGSVIATAVLTASVLRRQSLSWSWAVCGLPVGIVLWPIIPLISICFWVTCLLACGLGLSWHVGDLAAGGDHAQTAANRLRISDAIRGISRRRGVRREGWVKGGWMVVGQDSKRHPVSIPVGYESGSHALIVGATGSGKTVTQAWVVGRLIEKGHGAIVVDPKGDGLLRAHLAVTAAEQDRPFLEWTPDGPNSYNPYAHGTESEIADKALAGEQFTEPHYLRQSQRYLGHVVRALHATGQVVTAQALMEHMNPAALEATARSLPEGKAQNIHDYLDSLTDRQKNDLSGTRDRLAILAESELGRWLTPRRNTATINLPNAIRQGAVVYFRLDSDRRPLLASMLAAAVITDLNTIVADLKDHPIPTVVMVDEFSAIASGFIARLFGRARSSGISLVLATQELADMKTSDNEQLHDQVLGNLQTLIAHRQNVPDSAELIASFAGTSPAWITTQQTERGWFSNGAASKGSRRRGYEYDIHPSALKTLGTGHAVVITPGTGTPPAIASIHHPKDTRQ